MRAIQTGDLLYIFNPWSNGDRIFATATNGTQTYQRMAELAKENPAIEARHDLYQHRVVEELYSIPKDPDCLHNLIDNPEYAAALNQMRGDLKKWMVDTGDHCLGAFENRSDPAAMEKYVTDKESESAARGGRKKQALKILRMPVPDSVSTGQPVTVQISYKVPESIGETNLCVTLKADGDNGKRLDRETLKISGTGVAKVTLDVPADPTLKQVAFAAWVGKDHPLNLQFLQKGPVPVEP
jgi:N-sulfoglucosamine sulfohydrolase